MTAWVAAAMTLRCEPWNKGRLIDQLYLSAYHRVRAACADGSLAAQECSF
jgi:hypothetical protein